MPYKTGSGTLYLKSAPFIISHSHYVGKKEKEGPLGKYFLNSDDDTTFGEKTFEKAESELLRRSYELAVARLSSPPDFVFSGDLENQCVASHYALRDCGRPFIGIYGACSTMSEALGLAAVFADSGAADVAAAAASSHFCTAERQFRFPLEYGSFRPRTAQWTVTGSACAAVSRASSKPAARVAAVCFGRIVDLGVKDINNMGAAMAPAAADTLLRFFSDTDTAPSDYDAVITGDLGALGSRILKELMKREGIKLDNHNDCGMMIFDRIKQKVGSGGSGCGCSASVLSAYFLPKLERGELKKILFAATGALMNGTVNQQQESIPSISHLVLLTSP